MLTCLCESNQLCLIECIHGTICFLVSIMEKVFEELKGINELMLVQQQALGPHAQMFADGQCKQFLHKIAISAGLTPALATSFTSVVQQGLWTADQKQSLIKAVNDHLLGEMNSGSSSGSKRRANQKLSNFTAYLRAEDVAALQAEDVHIVTKLSQVCELCWKLALTMPDEPTFKHIVATTLAAAGVNNLDGQSTYNLVQEFKTLLRGNSKLKHLPSQSFHLEQYPSLPKDLPQGLYDHVYANSPPTGILLSNLAAVSAGVVLRKSSRALQPHLTPANLMPHMPHMPHATDEQPDGSEHAFGNGIHGPEFRSAQSVSTYSFHSSFQASSPSCSC